MNSINYQNTISQIYSESKIDISHSKISNIINNSQLPYKYQQRLAKTIDRRLYSIGKMKDSLNSFLSKENWGKTVFQELGISRKTTFQHQTHKHILILELSKEDIEKSFFPKQKLDTIENIGFLVKDHSLNFDIIIVSDKSLVEHEINESITDLFLATNQKKISIFQLDKVSLSEKKNLDRAILQDILSHLFSTNKEQRKNEVILYISYLENTISQYPEFQTELNQVKNYLNYLYSIKENLYKSLLFFISNPQRLYKSYPKEDNQEFEIQSSISDSLYSILSNCKIDSRFCTITKRVVNGTCSESNSFQHNSKFIEEISTCLNIDKDNNSYKLKYYFKKMIKLGKINEIIGEIEKNNIITIVWNNGVELKMKINSSGNISFLVEHTHIKETTTTTKFQTEIEEKIEDRNGNIRKLGESELSRKKINSKETTVIIDTKKDTASLISIQKWVSHIVNMKISQQIKKDIIVSKSIENKITESKEIIKTPFHIDNPDIHYLLSIYLKTLLDKGEVKQIVGNIGGEMRLVRNNGNIDELIISEDGYIGFNIVKTTRKEFQKTTTNTSDIKETNYNIGTDEFVKKDVMNFDQDVSFQLLEESSSLDSDTLRNKDNLVDNVNNIYNQQKEKTQNQGNKITRSIQERIKERRKKNIAQGMERFQNSSRKKLNQISKKREISNKFQHISTLYQSSIKYAVEKINGYLKEDLNIQEKKNPYLFQYKGKEFDILTENKKYIELISFFERKSDIDEELDRLQVTIKINKETDEIEIVNDWHRDGCNMCSSHQMFDNIFDESLEQLGLSPSRNDQKEEDFTNISYENIMEQTQAKLAYSLS